jgi:hypothetical protein
MTPDPLKIVVEGPTDAALLRGILGKRLATRPLFYSAERKISLASIGRNLLVHEGGPVLIVMDADTTNSQQAEEQRALVRLALERVAPGGEFDVFAFAPTLEIVFFEAPDALRYLLGRDIPSETLREGKLIPKPTLAALLGGYAEVRDRLLRADSDPELSELLASGQQAKAFNEAAERLLAQHADT